MMVKPEIFMIVSGIVVDQTRGYHETAFTILMAMAQTYNFNCGQACQLASGCTQDS